MNQADIKLMETTAELTAEKAVGKLRVEIAQIDTDVRNNKNSIEMNRKGIRRAMGLNVFGWGALILAVIGDTLVKRFGTGS